jgi:hypothetical protein
MLMGRTCIKKGLKESGAWDSSGARLQDLSKETGIRPEQKEDI